MEKLDYRVVRLESNNKYSILYTSYTLKDCEEFVKKFYRKLKKKRKYDQMEIWNLDDDAIKHYFNGKSLVDVCNDTINTFTELKTQRADIIIGWSDEMAEKAFSGKSKKCFSMDVIKAIKDFEQKEDFERCAKLLKIKQKYIDITENI